MTITTASKYAILTEEFQKEEVRSGKLQGFVVWVQVFSRCGYDWYCAKCVALHLRILTHREERLLKQVLISKLLIDKQAVCLGEQGAVTDELICRSFLRQTQKLFTGLQLYITRQNALLAKTDVCFPMKYLSFFKR